MFIDDTVDGTWQVTIVIVVAVAVDWKREMDYHSGLFCFGCGTMLNERA